MSINSEGTRREYIRIGWRNFVMSLPGGVFWLRVQCKLLKYNEKDVGPHKLTYPPDPPSP